MNLPHALSAYRQAQVILRNSSTNLGLLPVAVLTFSPVAAAAAPGRPGRARIPGMKASMFVWLGSGRARKRGVESQAFQLLDQAARAGLPVPAGAILLDDFFRFAVEKKLAQPSGDRIIISDAELWHNTLRYSIRLPRFGRPVGVHAAQDFSTGRAPAAAVNFDDPLSAAAAVAAMWSTWPTSGDARRDVLLIEAVVPEVEGTAATKAGAKTDTVSLHAALGSTDSLDLSRLEGWRRPDATLPPYARRLQQLLRGARRTFGPGDWRVDWADDGRVCWLLGATSLVLRKD